MTEKSFTEPADDSVRENLVRIRDTMAAACAAAGRPETDVSLLAVTKTVEPARINRAFPWASAKSVKTGCRNFSANGMPCVWTASACT